MSCNVHKGEEIYGRNIEYAGKFIVTCTQCDYRNSFMSEEEAMQDKSLHEVSHLNNISRLLMVGTLSCTRCKVARPVIEKYCNTHSIPFQYQDLVDISSEVMELIRVNNLMRAPVFVLTYEDGNMMAMSYEDLPAIMKINN